MEDRLTDEEWQDMIDTNPPDLPDWMSNVLPIVHAMREAISYVRKEF
jgi:hypothetical protein